MPTPPCLSPSGPAVLLIHSTDAAVVRSRAGVGNRLDLSAPLFRELTQYTLFSDITILYGGRWDTVGESRLLKPSRGARVILTETNCTLRKTGLFVALQGLFFFLFSSGSLSSCLCFFSVNLHSEVTSSGCHVCLAVEYTILS